MRNSAFGSRKVRGEDKQAARRAAAAHAVTCCAGLIGGRMAGFSSPAVWREKTAAARAAVQVISYYTGVI